jgi:hypothetical protein
MLDKIILIQLEEKLEIFVWFRHGGNHSNGKVSCCCEFGSSSPKVQSGRLVSSAGRRDFSMVAESWMSPTPKRERNSRLVSVSS